MKRLGSLGVYLRTMAAFLVVWAIVATWKGNTVLLPSPLAVIAAFVDLGRELELFEHAAVSLSRMLLSLSLAAGIAIPLGLAMGLDRRLDTLVDPTIEILRPISGIAFSDGAIFQYDRFKLATCHPFL